MCQIRLNYRASVISEKQKNNITNDNTVKDQVLDLSNTARIAEEVNSAAEDSSNIRAIKIGGELISIPTNPEELKKFISELKSNILKADNTLTDNFGFITFDKAIKRGSNSTVSINNSGKNNLEGFVSSFQTNLKAGKFPSINSDIQSRLKNINSEIISIETSANAQSPDTKTRLSELKNQEQTLNAYKNISEKASQVYKSINGSANVSNQAQLNQLKANVETSVKEYGGIIEQNKSLISEDCIPELQGVINKSTEKVNTATERVSLATNPNVKSNLRALGRDSNPPGVLRQYDNYIDLRQSGRRNRPNETLNPNGFLQSTYNDLQDDVTFAKKINDIAQRMDKMSPTDAKTALAEVQQIFSTQSGKPFIKQSNISAVQKILQAKAMANQAGSELASVNSQITPQDIQNAQRQANDYYQMMQRSITAKTTLADAKKLNNSVSLESTGFGPSVKNSGSAIQNQTRATIKTNESLADRTVDLTKAIFTNATVREENEEQQKLVNNPEQVGNYLENMQNGSHASLEIAFMGGVGNDLAGVDIGAKFGLTVEKSFGQGPSYLAHADIQGVINAHAGIKGIFETETELALGIQAGIAFRSSQEVQAFTKTLKNFLSEASSGGDYKPELDNLKKMIKENSYTGYTVAAQKSYNAPGLGLSVDLKVSSITADFKPNAASNVNYNQSIRDIITSGSIKYKDFGLSVTNETSKIINLPAGEKPQRYNRTTVELAIPVTGFAGMTKDIKSAIPSDVLLRTAVMMKAADSSLDGMSDNALATVLSNALQSASTSKLQKMMAKSSVLGSTSATISVSLAQEGNTKYIEVGVGNRSTIDVKTPRIGNGVVTGKMTFKAELQLGTTISRVPQ